MTRIGRRMAVTYVLTATYSLGVCIVLVNRKGKTATALMTVDYCDPDMPANNGKVTW